MKKLVGFIVLCFMIGSVSAQKRMPRHAQIQNLQHFDEAKFHFGFILGYNKADFFLDIKPNTFETDSLMSLNVISKPGFNLGIVSSWNITPMLKLRFLPTLSFQERSLEYTFYQQPDTAVNWTKPVESTFLDFPLLFKFRTQRINNFAAYVVGGGKFALDMQSNDKVDNNNASLKETVVKITKPDYGIEVGGGFDFFLQYFKFGLELRMGMGMKNVLIQENTTFSTPIDRIRNQTWTLSLTFEG